MRMKPTTGLSVAAATRFMVAGSRTRRPPGGVPAQASMSTLGSSGDRDAHRGVGGIARRIAGIERVFQCELGDQRAERYLVSASKSGVVMPPISST
jgi:hypothetical protein